jgi:DDE superfamily endonuclease./Tc5 transposase DNA-binding domain.
LTGIQLQKWFEDEYDQRINASTVSRIISARFDWLDTAKEHQLDTKKHRLQHWPEFKEVLYEWIQRAETQITIFQAIICEKARQFWPSIYPGKEMPQFSNGWLRRFQNRQNIYSNTRHGEAASISTDVDEEMISIRQVISKYSPKDVFNCDETGLYWRMIPNRSLTTHSIPGRKKDKARITLHFCTNSDASERIPVWIYRH